MNRTFPSIRVRLVAATPRPLDLTVASARTCYSPKGIVTPEAVAQRPKRRDTLAQELFRSGHHTTFQHAHFTFAIERVSRLFVWSFLHAHPFYNSEQVSQRYVAVQPDQVIAPPLPPGARTAYQETVAFQMDAYHTLTARLFPVIEAEYYRRFPARRHRPALWEREIRKKAQEIARYVLPLGTLTYLYHTVDAVTLLRYWSLARQPDAPQEAREVVEGMVAEVLRLDPAFSRIVEETPADPSGFPWPCGDHRTFREAFDRELGGRVSRLISRNPDNPRLVADGVRSVLGLPAATLSDEEAIALVLDPARTPFLGESLNLTVAARLTQALHHATYTFKKKLSHAADSQNQRHRLTPATRPYAQVLLTEEPDYIVPGPIREEPEILGFYQETMERIWEGIRKVPEHFAVYLLPNAVAVRIVETATLMGLRHKLAMRLCFNAQEEIWRAALEEALQIREVEPLIGRYLLPPCGLRARGGRRPICPEGKRYCGIRVWELDPSEYRRGY